MQKNIKIANIGGGYRQWTRAFMSDLALTRGLSGKITLYGTSPEAARRSAVRSVFRYTVCQRLEDALANADFVTISILPGTVKTPCRLFFRKKRFLPVIFRR